MRGIDLDIADGDFTVLVGPSGCGKSTLLRTIAGLEDVSEGEILIGDEIVNDMRPRDRDVAMVFQDYALYPHMTVEKNIGFGLRARKMAKTEIDDRVNRASAMLGIAQLHGRFPRQLSGGQRQRVAIGRAIVREPRLFLFDEPLSNLDAQLRDEMRWEIKRLHREISTTMIYVTHDQIEAMTLADRIVLMREGRIEQVGTPAELFERPISRFVAGFLGSPKMSFLPGRVVRSGGAAAVAIDGAALPFPLPHAYAARVATRALASSLVCVPSISSGRRARRLEKGRFGSMQGWNSCSQPDRAPLRHFGLATRRRWRNCKRTTSAILARLSKSMQISIGHRFSMPRRN